MDRLLGQLDAWQPSRPDPAQARYRELARSSPGGGHAGLRGLGFGFVAVGFARGKEKQPDLSATLRVLDEGGKDTSAKPFTGRLNKDVAPDAAAVPLQFGVTLNRAGRFTLELTATDHVSGQKSKVSMPLKVVGH